MLSLGRRMGVWKSGRTNSCGHVSSRQMNRQVRRLSNNSLPGERRKSKRISLGMKDDLLRTNESIIMGRKGHGDTYGYACGMQMV